MKRKPYWQVLGELNQRDYEDAMEQAPVQWKPPDPAVVTGRLCGRCKRRPVKKFSRCEACRAFERERRKNAEAKGNCQKCYSRPAMQGYKSCIHCRISAAKTRQKYKQEQSNE